MTTTPERDVGDVFKFVASEDDTSQQPSCAMCERAGSLTSYVWLYMKSTAQRIEFQPQAKAFLYFLTDQITIIR